MRQHIPAKNVDGGHVPLILVDLFPIRVDTLREPRRFVMGVSMPPSRHRQVGLEREVPAFLVPPHEPPHRPVLSAQGRKKSTQTVVRCEARGVNRRNAIDVQFPLDFVKSPANSAGPSAWHGWVSSSSFRLACRFLGIDFQRCMTTTVDTISKQLSEDTPL